jgi:hypothetical protein
MNKLTHFLLMSVALLAGCDDEPPAAGLPLPPASNSRWAALEQDSDGDGLAESITRYGYDTLGRRISQTTWIADRGIAIGDPVEVQTWVYDSASRVLTHRVEAGGGWRSNDANYGADGLLASTTLRWHDSPNSLRTTYSWQSQRLVEATQEGLTPATYRLSYDAAGRVEQVERRFAGSSDADVDTYNWRTDGQLAAASFSLSVGNLVLYGLEYDLNDRHVRTRKTDDGFAEDMRRHFHDTAGRLERVEADHQPVSFDEADFMPDVVHRIRWENGPCQPVFLLGLPPVFDSQTTAQARADGAMLGCAD